MGAAFGGIGGGARRVSPDGGRDRPERATLHGSVALADVGRAGASRAGDRRGRRARGAVSVSAGRHRSGRAGRDAAGRAGPVAVPHGRDDAAGRVAWRRRGSSSRRTRRAGCAGDRSAPRCSAGTALAVTSLAWLAALAAVGLALVPPVRRGLASVASRWPPAIDPMTTEWHRAWSSGRRASSRSAESSRGDTGGEGGGPLAVFGVLRRNELDLRPVLDVAVIAACAVPRGSRALADVGTLAAVGSLRDGSRRWSSVVDAAARDRARGDGARGRPSARRSPSSGMLRSAASRSRSSGRPPIAIAMARPATSAAATATITTRRSRRSPSTSPATGSTRTAPARTPPSRRPSLPRPRARPRQAPRSRSTATTTSSSSPSTRCARASSASSDTTSRPPRASTRSPPRASSSSGPTRWRRTPARRSRRCSSESTLARRSATAATSTRTRRATTFSPSASMPPA